MVLMRRLTPCVVLLALVGAPLTAWAIGGTGAQVGYVGGGVTQWESVMFNTTNTTVPTFGTRTTLCVYFTWDRK